MRNAYISFFLFFFLFFFLSFSNAYAYQEFSYNSNFNSDSTGILIYSPDSNSTLSYNATWPGASDGVAVLTTNGTASDIRIFMQEYSHAEQQVTQNLTIWIEYTDYSANIVLPPYKDSFVSLSYKSNNTLIAHSGYSYPMLYILDCSVLTNCIVINSTALTTTASQFNNASIYVPYAESFRIIRIELMFKLPASTDFILDKFKLYTYDIWESRTTAFEDFTTESIKYCDGGTQIRYFTTNTTPYYYFEFMASNNIDDDNICCVFFFGNITVGRSCKYVANSTVTYMFYARDETLLADRFAAYYGYDYDILLIHAINQNQLVYSSYTHVDGSATYPSRILFSGTTTSKTFIWNGATFGSTTKIHQTYNWSSVGFQGSKFYGYAISGGSPYYLYPQLPLYGETPSCDNIGWQCSEAADSEYYVSSTCTPSTPTSCQSCGCDGDRCDIPTFPTGSYCNLDDNTNKGYITFINTTTGCSYDEIYGECPYNSICVQQVSTLSINCYNNITGSYEYCINSTGGNSTCLTLNLCQINGIWTDCPSAWDNPLGAVALSIGGLAGIHDLTVAENFTSFVFSIILGFTAIVTVAILSKRNVDSKSLTSVGLGFGTFSLLMFSFLPDTITGTTWFPQWVALVLTAFMALLLSGGLSKITGGGN